MDSNLTVWGIGVAVTIAVSAFIRFFPKQKLMGIVGPAMFKAGKFISILGNTKMGKKAMDKVEEGILASLISIAMCGLVEFGKGLVADNDLKEGK